MFTQSIKTVIVALSLLCAVESRPMAPVAVAAAPFIGGAALSALIYAAKYKNSKMSFKEAMSCYSGVFIVGSIPYLNLFFACLFLAELEHGAKQERDRGRKPNCPDEAPFTGLGLSAGLITCFYSIPKALELAGVLKTIIHTHTITTTSSEWVWA